MADTEEKLISLLFFATPSDFRTWLEANHNRLQAQWIGFHKKSSKVLSITWPEAVDQALCFGWIDGVRRTIDANSYMIRFTPRKPRSTWSTVNINRVRELTDLGLIHPTGLAAFEKRTDDNSAIYSHEQGNSPTLDAEDEQRFRENEQAWTFFQSQPPSYRRAAIWWVISAKKKETQIKRLVTLMADSAQQKTIAPLTRKVKSD